MRLSVVIPVLNEETQIGDCLAHLERFSEELEVIVVDGGSDDATVNIVRRFPEVVLVRAARGRARQQNAGAVRASGDALLFLHADARLPENAFAMVRETLAQPGVAAGAFRTWHRPEHSSSKLMAAVLHIADARSRYTRLPYGDQGIFLTREMFERVGGFPEIELMEDLEISKRLRRYGRLLVVPAAVSVSGRRYESALLYQALLVNVFPLLYSLGVPARVLARLYGDPR